MCSVCVSPCGGHLFTVSWDKKAKMWDVQTGAELRSFEGHSDTVRSVCVSPCGGHLFTGSWDKNAKMWDVQTGAELHTFEHNDDVSVVQA